jgi:hypothetical protein
VPAAAANSGLISLDGGDWSRQPLQELDSGDSFVTSRQRRFAPIGRMEYPLEGLSTLML